MTDPSLRSSVIKTVPPKLPDPYRTELGPFTIFTFSLPVAKSCPKSYHPLPASFAGTPFLKIVV